MDLRHLRYFIGVAEEENVSKAAAKLYVSQPALSRQIRDLEDELGFALLERTAKSVRLTDAGRFFLEEARAVVQRAQDAVKRGQAFASGEKGEIHVGYAPSLTIEILPRTLRSFQREFPKVRVALHDLSTEEMLAQLRSGILQVALMVQPTRPMLRGLRFVELGCYPMCAAVAPKHPLAKFRTLSLSQILKEPLIGYSRSEYPEYHQEVSRIFAQCKGSPHIVEEHDGVASLMAAVEAGRGLALVPSCLAAMAGNRLKLIPLKPPASVVIVGAVSKADSLTPTTEKFIAATKSP
jgi:DNA-binding transcriptional LysR family regulator